MGGVFLECVGFSGNSVINFGCLFGFVTLMWRVTGAESGSKFGHWMMVCRWWLLFPEAVATGPSPVGWLKAETGLFLLLYSVYFFLSGFPFPSRCIHPNPSLLPSSLEGPTVTGLKTEKEIRFRREKKDLLPPKNHGFGLSNMIQSYPVSVINTVGTTSVMCFSHQGEKNISPPFQNV